MSLSSVVWILYHCQKMLVTHLCFNVQALHEDIELRKQNIEQAILNGLELLKQTTGEIKKTKHS